MTIRRLLFGTILAGLIGLTLVVAGQSASTNPALSWETDRYVGDSTAVHELSAVYFTSRPVGVQSTANTTETVAILAAELLLDPTMRSVAIPLLRK